MKSKMFILLIWILFEIHFNVLDFVYSLLNWLIVNLIKNTQVGKPLATNGSFLRVSCFQILHVFNIICPFELMLQYSKHTQHSAILYTARQPVWRSFCRFSWSRSLFNARLKAAANGMRWRPHVITFWLKFSRDIFLDISPNSLHYILTSPLSSK